MTRLEKTSLIFFALVVFGILYFQRCNKPPITIQVEQTDSNAFYNHLEDQYEAQMFRLSDSLETLKQRLKTAENNYKLRTVTKYIEGDISYRVDTVDYECCSQIPEANRIIETQDSVIMIQELSLSACMSRVDNLKAQVNYDTIAYKDVVRENVKCEKKLKRAKMWGKIMTGAAFVLGLLI